MNKDYTRYQWSDFLEDETFLNWVKYPEKAESVIFINNIKKNETLYKECEHAKKILSNLRYKNLSKPLSKERIWEKIEQQKMPSDTRIRRLLYYATAIAASFTLIIYFTFFNKEMIVEKTQMAQHRMIRLPDSSYITLNADSEIEYDLSSFQKNRTIQLKGEAFFQVKKGIPFKVQTKLGEINVIGTSFNVYSRNDIMNVSCLTGKVLVHFIKQNKNFTLNSGMSISNKTSTGEPVEFNIEEYKNWRDGYYYYQNASLSEVIDELKRQYNIQKLDFRNNILTYQYSGYFKKDNIEEALESVFLPLKLKATYSNGVLSIKE
ncbi:MAG: FecR family protein [Saprospiraceae bacterium]|nr:FecR family protein [Saprospiraceae bacterium]